MNSSVVCMIVCSGSSVLLSMLFVGVPIPLTCLLA